MIIVGLTGSIGMGKSTAAAMLRGQGVPVFDADRFVHSLLAPRGAAVAAVAAAFPGVRDGSGAIDRNRLGAEVFRNEAALRRLEAIVHPLVAAAERRFVRRMRARRQGIVVLDVPLLFEARGAARCDRVIVVSAPPFLQRQRVLRRPGFSAARLAQIQAQQMPDHEKRRRADFVVPSGLGRAPTLRRLKAIVRMLRAERRWHTS
jgi:dephospho-CoA kinase